MLRVIENPDEFRKNITSRLESCKLVPDVCINLEKGIYNFSIKEANNKKLTKKWDNPLFVRIYLDRLRTIYFNIQNPILREIINSKKVKAHEIAFMTHQEMDPERWSSLIDAVSYTHLRAHET